MPRPKADDPDAPLKRLGGGRWQTRDERFTIEPQSGTWVVVDAEQTDDLGLPLVRGPFGSLGDAKSAITDARSSEPATSPLAGKLGEQPPADQPAALEAQTLGRAKGRAARKPADPVPGVASPRGRSGSTARARPAEPPEPVEPPEPAEPPEPVEPRWLRELEPQERRRARRVLERLTEDGAKDAEGLVRRDVVGDVAAVAAWAISRAVRDLGEQPPSAAVVRLLADGRDERLDVRWHLVDGDGRRIHLDANDVD